MKITFLGTNGWYDTSTGNTICILIETERYDIILDAGNGLYKADRYISNKKPVYLFLSHFHLDHIIGLHILGKFNFNQGLYICGQTGTKEILNKIINLPFSMPIERLGYKIDLYDLPEKKQKIPFKFEFLPLFHSSLTLGYRFELDNKIISYCPDTGYCENAVNLAKNSGLLITECAFKPGQASDDWPHLNPETAARIAKEAAAKKLALVHFDASIYQTLEERKQAEEVAKKIFGNTVAAIDDMQIEM
ncbi:MAG: seceted metal-dependent hydrolase [Nitrospirae bacterium]|nr:MAG: seceted metal-dependent hydrolase [Nitrospirota bacterium]